MLLIVKLFLPSVILAVVFSLVKTLQFVWHTHKSPLRHLQGPKGPSFIFGNLNELIDDEDGKLMGKWVKEYGETLRLKGLFNRHHHLLTVDICAINYILTHSNEYQKPPVLRHGLADIFGEGLLLAEGIQHRQQRRIMNPAFGPSQIRAFTDTFLAKTSQLCESWFSEISRSPGSIIRIDTVPWLNRLTLDIIGLTGFSYNLDSLSFAGQANELSKAFSTILSTSGTIGTIHIVLRGVFPALRFIPTAENRKIRAAKHAIARIGEVLLTDAKAATLSSEMGMGEIKKSDRDLLSLLVKANTATDIPDNQKLSDKDVIAQVPTFFVAGHETTSTAAAWALYAITQAPEVQMKLRDELLSVDTDTPSMDQLMALPYLDVVVKEILRIHTPLTGVPRVAMRDDVIPVGKSYVDRHGTVCDSIRIAKGDEIVIPILTINTSQELWGPDAHEFKPERWTNIPEAASRVPGVWSHLLTFIGGPRGCIGYRFAVVQVIDNLYQRKTQGNAIFPCSLFRV